MDSNLLHILIVSVFCFILIAFRCGYRLLSKCKIHHSCHRTWHQDDFWMAVAALPLVGRAVCIGIFYHLSKPDATPAEQTLARKLLLPGRLCYALFEWCLKLCIINLYFRISDHSTYMYRSSITLWWCIILTFVAILFASMFECRPLSLFWLYDPLSSISCQKGLANLLTMAISNIITDVALILLPIPVLWKMRLDRAEKIQLILLFSVGIFVIAVTIARLPLIFSHSEEQVVRSMWASIEMGTACIVANVAFFYALLKDIKNGHRNARASLSARGRLSSVSGPSTLELAHTRESLSLPKKMNVQHIELQ